jgi:hypothetical protein
MTNGKLLWQLRHLLAYVWVTAMRMCVGLSIFFIGVAIRAMLLTLEVRTGIEYLLDTIKK